MSTLPDQLEHAIVTLHDRLSNDRWANAYCRNGVGAVVDAHGRDVCIVRSRHADLQFIARIPGLLAGVASLDVTHLERWRNRAEAALDQTTPGPWFLAGRARVAPGPEGLVSSGRFELLAADDVHVATFQPTSAAELIAIDAVVNGRRLLCEAVVELGGLRSR